MGANVHQFLCLQDNYCVLIRDQATGATACIDAPEAEPIFAALNETGWNLTDVLLTHHHADHIQGVPELRARFPHLRVCGPAKERSRIPDMSILVSEGDYALVGSLGAKVLETPGHTSGHVVYHFENDGIAFCGDTLFSLGCGRAFEAPYSVMWNSLEKLAALPPATLIFCGHEYTEANGRFALTVDPANSALQARVKTVANLRSERRSTLPTTFEIELATNPFLRARDPAVQKSVNLVGADPASVFAELRSRKDRF